jgi:hypothetical protein
MRFMAFPFALSSSPPLALLVNDNNSSELAADEGRKEKAWR